MWRQSRVTKLRLELLNLANYATQLAVSKAALLHNATVLPELPVVRVHRLLCKVLELEIRVQ